MSQNNFRSIDSVGRNALLEELGETAFSSDNVIQGMGDDAAVLDHEELSCSLLTSETFVEGVDFDLTYTPLQHLGYKVISAAVSDIYAMNGTSVAVTVNLGLPNKLSVDMIKTLYKGVEAATRKYGCPLTGGDLTASHNVLIISVSVYGRVDKDSVTYRSGARAEDAICVTGDLGGAMAGLRILMREKKYWEEHGKDAFQPDLGDYEYVVKRQLAPDARQDLIELFEKENLTPTSMIDLSKGLLNDLGQLLKASDKGCKIFQAALPIAIQTRQVADEMKEDVDKYALYGGEDYELMFTLAEQQVEQLASVFNDFVVIGKISEENRLLLQTADGEELLLENDNKQEGQD